MAPAALHDWWAVAEDLIGKILDIGALLERKEPLTKRQVSLMRRYFRGYDRDLEKLEKLETDIEKNSALVGGSRSGTIMVFNPAALAERTPL